MSTVQPGLAFVYGLWIGAMVGAFAMGVTLQLTGALR